MQWIEITDEEQLKEVNRFSQVFPVLIFKHSTRCSISTAALFRLERNWEGCKMSSLKTYFLDLLKHRKLSNMIADQYAVHHESPQVLLIKDGECIYESSHLEIQVDEIAEQLFGKN